MFVCSIVNLISFHIYYYDLMALPVAKNYSRALVRQLDNT